MNCDAFLEEVGALALGALEPAEAALALQHLREEGPHQGCETAYAQARATAGALFGTLAPVEPSSRVLRNVLTQVGHAPRTGRTLAIAGWAVAAAAGVLLGVMLTRPPRPDPQTQAALASAEESRQQSDAAKASCVAALKSADVNVALQAEALKMLAQPGSRVVAFKAQPGKSGQATAIVSGDTQRAMVLGALDDPGAGKTFQLWIIRGKAAPIPAGLMETGSHGVMLAEIPAGLLRAGVPNAFAISREPAGGSKTPTEVLLVGAVG